MNDLISRQKTIAHLKHRLYETQFNNIDTEHPYYEEIADNRIETWINELPSVQPEQKRGRWVIDNGCVCCSECGEPNMEWNYCPNCGARMDGETE